MARRLDPRWFLHGGGYLLAPPFDSLSAGLHVLAATLPPIRRGKSTSSLRSSERDGYGNGNGFLSRGQTSESNLVDYDDTTNPVLNWRCVQ
ncbi:GM23865 [Drosophila sechellia]|uniref:GM23865 n=1 Tax=Drosophila sechellia TaxID=7238 RepID=B4HJ85_DROSE|nr:GM23865 [Drosophila sechellia]